MIFPAIHVGFISKVLGKRKNLLSVYQSLYLFDNFMYFVNIFYFIYFLFILFFIVY